MPSDPPFGPGRVKIAPTSRPLLKRGDDRTQSGQVSGAAQVNRAAGIHDVARTIAHRACERLQQRSEPELTRMGRESVIGGDENIRPIQQTFGSQSVLNPADLGVNEPQRGARNFANHSVACAVASGSPNHMNVTSGRTSSRPTAQVRVDGVAVTWAFGVAAAAQPRFVWRRGH